MKYPYVPAAFINAVAEEGTLDEAVSWLQKLWNENCALRGALEEIATSRVMAADLATIAREVLAEDQGRMGSPSPVQTPKTE
jgi:hypothetical protein